MIRMWSSILVLTVLITGCAGFESDRTADLNPEEVDRQEGIKNLAAIAELQISLPLPHAPSTPPISAAEETPASAIVPPPDQQISQPVVAPSWFSLYAPSRSSSLQSQRLFSSAPPIGRPPHGTPSPYSLNPSLVPPYTFFAPTGPTSPGSVRCVPDYLGGSRCSSNP